MPLAYRRGLALAATAATLACAGLPPPRGPIGPPPDPPEGAGPSPDAVVTLGPPTLLLAAGRLGLAYFPDQPVTIIDYTEHDRGGGRGVQICLARAPAARPPVPGAFTKWFQGAFSEPALGGRDTPVLSAQPFDGADAFGPHVLWSAALHRYVMTFDLDAWRELRERKGLRRSGVYFATSEDGVAWSRPEPLFIDWPVNVVGLPVSWHPAILLDEDSSTAGWLVYGHTARWDPPRGTPHHLWGRRITLAPRP